MGFVTSEIKDGICILRLDHGKPNSISQAVADELIGALDEAEKSADAVVLFGREGMFSGGFHLPTMAEGPAAARGMLKSGASLLMSIYTHPKPIVIGCAGHAIAMGAFILMAGDERLCAQGEFKIGMNETAIGMTLPTFGFELARARLSKRHFDRAVVHSTIYDPDGAREVGIVDRVVAADRLEAECLAAAAKLATLKQPAFRNNKRIAHAETIDRVLSTLDANLDSLMPG